MKVLVYIEKADVRGGIEIFAERHVASLRAAGHDVEVLGDWGTGNGERGIGNWELGTGNGERGGLGVFDEIIVHKCTDVDTLAMFPPEKTVLYVHDHEPICPRGYAYTPLGKNCTRPGGFFPCIFCAPACRSWKAALGRVFSQRRRIAVMSRFKKIVVISDFMKSRLVANGIPSDIVEVKPPTVDVLNAVAQSRGEGKGSASSASQRLCVENNVVDLLYVGQLIRGKGVQLLLAAMARMKTPRTLDVVGTGNMESKLKAMAEELGLGGRVRFNGFQRNPQDWMRRASCVVVPSFWQEPYGLVAAEAVALGRKVVAFAIGGLPEACQGKATLVPPGDVAALADALEGQ